MIPEDVDTVDSYLANYPRIHDAAMDLLAVGTYLAPLSEEDVHWIDDTGAISLPSAVVQRRIAMRVLSTLIDPDSHFMLPEESDNIRVVRGGKIARELKTLLENAALYTISYDTTWDLRDAASQDLERSRKVVQQSLDKGTATTPEAAQRMANMLNVAVVPGSGSVTTPAQAKHHLSDEYVVYPEEHCSHIEETPFPVTFVAPAPPPVGKVPEGVKFGHLVQMRDWYYCNPSIDAPGCAIGFLMIPDGTWEIGMLLTVPYMTDEVVIYGYVSKVTGADRTVAMPSLPGMMDRYLRRMMHRKTVKKVTPGALTKKTIRKRMRKRNLPCDLSDLGTYYTLHIDKAPHAYFKTARRQMAAERQMRYRHQRAGHYRLKVRRGALPMPFKEYEWCKKHGYEIYADKEVPEHRQVQLEYRGHDQRSPGEWLAMKVSTISPTMVGSEELPLRTAVRQIGG